MYEIDQSAATQRKCIQKLDHKFTVNYITRLVFFFITNQYQEYLYTSKCIASDNFEADYFVVL